MKETSSIKFVDNYKGHIWLKTQNALTIYVIKPYYIIRIVLWTTMYFGRCLRLWSHVARAFYREESLPPNFCGRANFTQMGTFYILF